MIAILRISATPLHEIVYIIMEIKDNKTRSNCTSLNPMREKLIIAWRKLRAIIAVPSTLHLALENVLLLESLVPFYGEIGVHLYKQIGNNLQQTIMFNK